jgi:hypothetical protein
VDSPHHGEENSSGEEEDDEASGRDAIVEGWCARRGERDLGPEGGA